MACDIVILMWTVLWNLRKRLISKSLNYRQGKEVNGLRHMSKYSTNCRYAKYIMKVRKHFLPSPSLFAHGQSAEFILDLWRHYIVLLEKIFKSEDKVPLPTNLDRVKNQHRIGRLVRQILQHRLYLTVPSLCEFANTLRSPNTASKRYGKKNHRTTRSS